MAISKIVVVDGNNLIVRIDRGVAGRSVTDVDLVVISGSLYLVFTFSDGTTDTVGPVGTVAYVGTSPIVVTGSVISLSTVPVNLGGTGQITANAGFNALAPTQTGNTGKYLKTDGTNSAWDLLDISTADITGTLPIVNGGTGQTTANTGLNALLPLQTGNANKYLQTDGTNTSWDAISLSTADITGVLPVVNGGTGASTAGGALTNLGAIGSVTSADGSIVVLQSGTNIDLAVSAASPASTLLTQVRNTTGATLTKGTVVYISGATGQISTVSKAIASSDATSAQTLGMITTNLANNSNGYVTVFGLLQNMDTSAYTDGAQLYLSGTVAGAVTATKPSAPIHLVYVAVVEYAHPTQGKLLVKVQNGYELAEIHDVSIVSPTTGQTLVYNSVTDLWVNNTVSLTAGINGTLPVANGGTGVTTSTGTGSVVLSTSPTLVTPVLGVATGTSFQGIIGNVTPAAGTFTTISGAILSRVVVIADATSITVNADTTDIATQANTQAVGTLTINAPTGTAINGQKFIVRLTSTNVQTFSFNAVFSGSTDLTLPTVSSGGGLTDYLGFIYNSTSAKWQMIAKVFGF
jgi:hypothetical protein